MNGIDWLLIMLVLAAILFAARKAKQQAGSGGCGGCGGGCAGCDQACIYKKEK